MTNNEKALNMLGMATRAGKIITGEGLVLQAVRSQKVKLVFVANDASDNTRKKLTDKCSYYAIPCTMEFSQMEISQAIGRNRMICGVSDAGFAKKMKELLSN